MSILENFLIFFIQLSLKLLGTVFGVVVNPLLLFFTNHVPSFTAYLGIFSSFYLRILNGVAFAKEVFFNTTGYPRLLFYSLCTFFFVKLLNMNLIRIRRFIFNVYYFLRGSRGISNELRK